jgi:hypothetical protein
VTSRPTAQLGPLVFRDTLAVMDCHELADFVANQMQDVYQPATLGVMLDSGNGVTSEGEASAATGRPAQIGRSSLSA